MQQAIRQRRAAASDVFDAAAAPGLTLHHFRKIKKERAPHQS
jgi:hypothetical protein